MVSYGSLNRIKLSLQKSKSYFFFLHMPIHFIYCAF